MSQLKQSNLTKGPILNKLLFIAVPIMGTQLFQMMYNLIDMFLLGRVSSDAVAATGTAGMYLWLAQAFLLFGRMGAEIGVSQSLGSEEVSAAKKYSQNSIFIALVSGVLFTAILMIFVHPLIGFFQIQEAHVAQAAVDYLLIVALSIPLSFISNAINGAFNGAGNSKLPFYINAFGMTFNVILSPLFIFTFDLGIHGAAMATVIAQGIVCASFLLAIKYHKSRPFEDFNYKDILNYDKPAIKQIFSWSLPISIESLCFTFLSMIIARYISLYGAGAIAAQRIGSQVESLSWLIGGGFASALTAFMGQNFGAGKWDRIHKGFKISTVIMCVWGVFVSLLLFFGAEQLFALFINEADIIALGVDYLRIFALAQFFTCIEALAAGAFRGVGKTQPPSIVSITFNALRIPAAILLSQTALGLNGIWWGMALGNIMRGLVLIIWYMAYSRKQKQTEECPQKLAQRTSIV